MPDRNWKAFESPNKEFDENGRYGMHSTTGFLASHGFVKKKVILDFSSMTATFAEARFR